MNEQLIYKLIEESKELASQWAIERGVCGEERYRMMCDRALITLVVRDIVAFIGPIDIIDPMDELLAETQSEIKHRYEVDIK